MLEIEILPFRGYNNKLREVIFDGIPKIYLIDFELDKEMNGNDIAHEIRQDAFDWKQRFADELSAVTGVPPTLMRAPGGSDDFYVENGIGYPLIHWSLSSADSGNDAYRQIAQRVIYRIVDGDIVLMHDINKGAYRYTQSIVEALNRRGFLCVTVQELFADAGVPLMENQVYYGVGPAVEK